MGFRPALAAAEQALTAARANLPIAEPHVRQELAQVARSIKEQIERMPQVSAVRHTAIALHNLAVTLADPDGDPAALAEELDASLDGLRELLDEPTFGFTPEELRRMIDDALLARGVAACLACRHSHLAIDVAYTLVRPYPSDPSIPPSQIPSALIRCARCGCTWSHDLRTLGVL